MRHLPFYFLIVTLQIFFTPVVSRAEQNLIVNGDFSRGSSDTPRAWRRIVWSSDHQTSLRWIAPYASNPGEVEIEITSAYGNDARWVQTVHLDPGWYYIAADVRTENVGWGPIFYGATVGIAELGGTSEQVKGTTQWGRVGFSLKVPAPGADVDITLRLGGLWAYNNGRAFFRNVSVYRVEAPIAQGGPELDLKALRAHWSGSRWSLVAAFAFLFAMAIAGWRMFGEQRRHPATRPLPVITSRPDRK
ncbi:MAG TPA: hypothetical protein VEF03_06865 [Candidatus Binataceae bacterium]|nr:hypothetical protein [Candidatus Binataceae bacterium]